MTDTFGLREAIEHSLACFFLSRPDGTILDANQAAVELFGWSKSDLRRIGRDGLFDVDDPAYHDAIRTRDRVGKVRSELLAKHKDGRRMLVEFNSTLFTGTDGEAYSSTFITDISERKRKDREIRLLINNTAEAYILTDQDLRILSFNQQFQRLYKRHFGIEVVRGDHILDYSPRERRSAAATLYVSVLNGETMTSEITVTDSDGDAITYLLRYSPAYDENNEVIGAFVTATDITELINKQKTLVESNQRLQYVTQATRDAIWDWNLRSGDVFWGEGFHTTYGYPKGDHRGSAEGWRERMHPDDRDRVETLVRQAIVGQEDTISAEYRYQRADGSYAMVSDRAVIVRNADGEAIRLVGAMQDITLQKNLERQRLLLSEIAQISAQSSSLQTMIDHSLHKIVAYGGYLVGEVWLIDIEQHFCYLASDYRGTTQAIAFREAAKHIRTFRKGEGLPGLTWERGSFQIIQEVDHDPVFLRAESARKAGLKSFFGIPLTVHGTVVGVLLLGSTDINADKELLLSQFDRIGPFLGMEIQRKQQEDLLRRIAWEQSHLVRAPLARLLGLADLLRQGDSDSDEVSDLLAQIVSSAEELDLIIRGIASSSSNHPSSRV